MLGASKGGAAMPCTRSSWLGLGWGQRSLPYTPESPEFRLAGAEMADPEQPAGWSWEQRLGQPDPMKGGGASG